MLLPNPFLWLPWVLLSYTPLHGKKYASPEYIGRIEGPEAEAEARRRAKMIEESRKKRKRKS